MAGGCLLKVHVLTLAICPWVEKRSLIAGGHCTAV